MEIVSEHGRAPDERRQNIPAKIMRAVLVRGVGVKFLQERARRKNVIPHRGVNTLGIGGQRWRIRSFFVEGKDGTIRRRLDYAEFFRVFLVDGNGGHRDRRALALVKLDHLPDVHPVNVVRAENRDHVRDRPVRSG